MNGKSDDEFLLKTIISSGQTMKKAFAQLQSAKKIEISTYHCSKLM